ICIENWSSLGSGRTITQVIPRIQRLLHQPSNDSQNASKNASSHYVTSNTMPASFLFLDMSYSCLIWKDPSFREYRGKSLEQAQTRKVHNIVGKSNIA
ncbi:hypothetical protein BJ878DRAFT_427698, partial [Calycina marina]